MRNKSLRDSILIAILLGVVYPLILGRFAAIYVPGRDELPSLHNPLGILTFCGAAIFALPLLITWTGLEGIVYVLHEHGLVIPLFDQLTNWEQTQIYWAIGYFCNLLVWLVIVLSIQRIRRRRLSGRSSQEAAEVQEEIN